MQIGLLLIFAVIGVVVALIAQFYSAKAAVGFAKELTDDLYRHILSLPKDSRDRLTTSSLVTRLTFRYLTRFRLVSTNSCVSFCERPLSFLVPFLWLIES